ncbi:hypothetical protein SAY86_013921 [Trapa natans]|uniref:Pyridine nucleotide-disulfide oxidoreductase domain-containing protein 2 n=1 Tax=Trapa natans TaxID=22666 RepID=A0AAN7KZL5_TRANT|nr:hypothetical protein SAY86_013921 [Trapa natans]
MWGRGFASTARAAVEGRKWDAVVIGAGHNGLTAAAYLARGGMSVAVLERRHVIGGAAVTEEIVPGFRFSRCSYLLCLLRPSIIRLSLTFHTFWIFNRTCPSLFVGELELKRHGLKLLRPMAAAFTPCSDGRYLLLSFDEDENRREISKFSRRDADAYMRYENQLDKFSSIMNFLLDSHPPEFQHEVPSFSDRMRSRVQKSVFWARCLRQILSMGQKNVMDFVDLLLSPTTKQMVSIDSVRSGYVLLHHVMGEFDGDRNVWAHVQGGMGSVSLAISNAAKEAGVHILTNTEVDKTISPPGKHVVSLFTQYTPYKPSNGRWEDLTYREQYVQRCFSLIDEYAPGFSSSVVGFDLLTPPDLEREMGLTGSSIS